jgi:hypothetical protein
MGRNEDNMDAMKALFNQYKEEILRRIQETEGPHLVAMGAMAALSAFARADAEDEDKMIILRDWLKRGGFAALKINDTQIFPPRLP